MLFRVPGNTGHRVTERSAPMISTPFAIVLALCVILGLGLAARWSGRSRPNDRGGVHVF